MRRRNYHFFKFTVICVDWNLIIDFLIHFLFNFTCKLWLSPRNFIKFLLDFIRLPNWIFSAFLILFPKFIILFLFNIIFSFSWFFDHDFTSFMMAHSLTDIAKVIPLYPRFLPLNTLFLQLLCFYRFFLFIKSSKRVRRFFTWTFIWFALRIILEVIEIELHLYWFFKGNLTISFPRLAFLFVGNIIIAFEEVSKTILLRFFRLTRTTVGLLLGEEIWFICFILGWCPFGLLSEEIVIGEGILFLRTFIETSKVVKIKPGFAFFWHTFEQ